MRNTLGLHGDLDDVELVEDLEAAFGIKFSEEETKTYLTVGDIFSRLIEHFSDQRDRNQSCASAMAFYRLRRAVRDMGCLMASAPASRLSDISSLTPKALFQDMQSRTGLRLPGVRLTRLGEMGLAALLLGSIASFMALYMHSRLAMLAFSLAVVGAIVMHLDRGKLPDECQTLGDLARKVAGLNFGQLVSSGARPRDKDIWNALLAVLTEHSLIPKSEITPDTFFI